MAGHGTARTLTSVLHGVITWVITAVAKCYTLTGLLMSGLTWASAAMIAVALWMVYNPQDPVSVIMAPYTCVELPLSTMTLITNLVLVIIPKFRRNIGNQWRNNQGTDDQEQEQKGTDLY